MKTTKLIQPGSKKLKLIQYIMKNNIRVFKRAELEAKVAKDLQLSYQSYGLLLHNLCQERWIKQIRRGIYIVANTATPIYEQEIAMVLINPAMISHYSAFRHHHLTDQLSNCIQITTVNSVFIPHEGRQNKKAAVKINGFIYEFIRVNKDKFFGAETAWIGDGKFQVTDLERTLLDGLSRPHYCGGFQEVIHAFNECFKKVNLDKIIKYAIRLDAATSRRLGWILNNFFGISDKKINCLVQKDSTGYRLLDSSRDNIGAYDTKWRLRLNHNIEYR